METGRWVEYRLREGMDSSVNLRLPVGVSTGTVV